jgi:hypothetical protein
LSWRGEREDEGKKGKEASRAITRQSGVEEDKATIALGLFQSGRGKGIQKQLSRDGKSYLSIATRVFVIRMMGAKVKLL